MQAEKNAVEPADIDIRSVRGNLVNKGLIFFALVSPLALLVSFGRIPEFGWHPIHYVHIGLMVLIVAGAIFRKRLSFDVRAGLLLGSFLVIGVSNLPVHGLLSIGFFALFVFAVLTAIVYGTRAGLAACGIDLLFIIAVGFFVCSGAIAFPFSASEYMISPMAWSAKTIAFFLFAPTAIIAFGVIFDSLVKAYYHIRESERKHRQLVDNAPIGIYRTGIGGEILKANTEMAVMFGYESPEELISSLRNSSNLYADPEYRARLIEQGLGLPGKNRFEVEWKRKDGTLFLGLLYARAVPDENGQTAFFEGFIDDISERKQAEAVLRESELRYKMIFEEAPVAITLTRGTDVVYVNPAVAGMFGYADRDEVMALRPLEMFTPEWRPRIMEFVERRSEGVSAPNTYEAECRRKDGTVFPVIINVTRAVFPEGPVTMSFIVDISEKKEHEQKIKAGEEKYRILFESANDAILLLEKDRIVDCNAKTLAMFGASREQIIGRTPLLFSPEMQPDGRESGKRIFESLNTVLQGEPQFFEWKHRRFDDTLFDAEVSLTDINVEGNRYVLAIVRDVTWRKTAEQEKKTIEQKLHQSQRIEAIGTLASGIAHDFNNILSSILGFSELVKYDLQEQNSDMVENVEAVIKAGLRAKELVQHILTFSRSAETQKGPVLPALLVKEAVKLLRASLPAFIEIEIKTDDSDTIVFGDATHIHQVIMNLCVNAVHAMKTGQGRLEISLEKVLLPENESTRLEELTSGAYLKLDVSDTGHGMRKEIIDRIFDPFFTTKEKGEGTGMGLSVVHGIVKDMNGAIRVESELEKGTTFHVWLPVYNGPVESSPESDPRPLRKGKGRILFVDDEKVITVMAGKALQKMGYEVKTMADSLDALEVFSSEPEAFDLIITDLTMPKMDGLALSKKIVEKRPGIPIVLCTGFSEGITSRTLDKTGIYKMVMKPLILSELADIVKDAMSMNKKEDTPRDKISDH